MIWFPVSQVTGKVFGHTLSVSACFRIQAYQNMQSLLGFDSRINKHPGLGTP
jgi:hypothetical protein